MSYDLNEMPDRRRRAEDRLAEAEVARQFREKYDNERNAELAALRQKLEQAENRERLALTEIKTLRDEKAALEARFALAAEIVKAAGEYKRAMDAWHIDQFDDDYAGTTQQWCSEAAAALDALLAKWKDAK